MPLLPRLSAALTTAVVIAPLAPLTLANPPSESPPPQTVTREIQLAAMVPPGGLITSFLNNQGIYCSLICPLLLQTAGTAISTTLQEPGVFLAALPTEGLLKAIGIAGASMTGPTDAAMEQAIAVDAAIPAKRALNALEVGVVGLLNIIPAIPGGPGAVLNAIQQFRQQTFDALNAPVVPNPAPTVMPQGVFQVAVIGAINVVAAVIFPAFNDFLAGAFQVPNAVAQTLATTGDPVRAFTAGLTTAVGVVNAAGTVIANTIATELNNVRTAAMEPIAAVQPVTPKLALATPVGTPKLTPPASTITPMVTTSTVDTSKNLATPPLPQIGGQFHNALPAVTTLPTVLKPPLPTAKPLTAINPGGQFSDRDSHSGIPPRPALRANR